MYEKRLFHHLQKMSWAKLWREKETGSHFSYHRKWCTIRKTMNSQHIELHDGVWRTQPMPTLEHPFYFRLQLWQRLYPHSMHVDGCQRFCKMKCDVTAKANGPHAAKCKKLIYFLNLSPFSKKSNNGRRQAPRNPQKRLFILRCHNETRWNISAIILQHENDISYKQILQTWTLCIANAPTFHLDAERARTMWCIICHVQTITQISRTHFSSTINSSTAYSNEANEKFGYLCAIN